MAVGYEHLRQHLDLPVLPPARVAEVRPVTRIIHEGRLTSVPATVAPRSDRPLDHILFALKHEGTNLQILSTALPHVDADDLRAELRESPTGQYIRTACHLWESYTGRELSDLPEINGPTAPLFDPDRYYTVTAARDPKYRVAFNGLGTFRYCATIEKTPALQRALERDVLARVEQFAAAHKGDVLDRTLEWAYLSETHDSFAIEREEPGAARSKRFVALLHQAHDGAPLTEEYLAHLLSETLNNPREHASEFRTEQNWLAGGGRGPAGVTYVPPPPALCRELMEELMGLVNGRAKEVPPVLLASISKFGFVFLHPFMDGNGRLSRFLFHKSLCLSGRLGNGLLLPVSTAMHRHEADYLIALKGYSRPVRDLWDVGYAGEDSFDFAFRGSEMIYRYWDATACAEFGARMADQALEHELIAETQFLQRFDRILHQVSQVYDVRSTLLNPLIAGALDNGGVVSNNKRKRVAGIVPEAAFGMIEQLARQELAEAAPRSAPDESGPHM